MTHPELNICERTHLGKRGIIRHDELQDLITQSFDAAEAQTTSELGIKNGFLWNSAVSKTSELLGELIELRQSCGLPNNGDCHKCDFNKPCYLVGGA